MANTDRGDGSGGKLSTGPAGDVQLVTPLPAPPVPAAPPERYPTQYASGYSLDLYCDRRNERHPFRAFPQQFTGETFAECAREARHRGWVIHRKLRTATCPTCTGTRQRKEKTE